MCIVSFVSREYVTKPSPYLPYSQPWQDINPNVIPNHIYDLMTIHRTEYDKLKKEVEDLKKELQLARQQDIKDGNSDCHMEDKINIIKGLAKALGIDMENVFEGHK